MKSYGLAVALVALALFTGCKDTKSDGPALLRTSSVEQVDQWIGADQCTAVDANNPGTREQMGIVPGAIRLTSYDSYDLSELPADKARRLIFYCANTQCGASHTAAHRAVANGYSNVEVMAAGIAGWVNAGKKVDKI